MASISVVITTLDDRLTLRDCLDGVLAGSPSVTEILVVDRGSVDGTPEIARRAGAPVRLLEHVGSRPTEASAAGEAEAQGDVVALVPSRAFLRAGAMEAAAANSTGHPAALDLRPVGATAFGRAAAAVVGSGAFGVEIRHRDRSSVDAADRSCPPSSYVIADTAAGLASEAYGAGVRARPPSRATATLVVAAGGLAVLGRGWLRAVLPLGHAATTAVRAILAGRDPGVAPHRAFLAAEVWDWANGLGQVVAALGRLRRLRR